MDKRVCKAYSFYFIHELLTSFYSRSNIERVRFFYIPSKEKEMNAHEKKMVEILKDLRDNHGVTEVKAEFESEGTRLNELMRLKDVALTAGLNIALKIGGPEAARDLMDALLVGVSCVVAPMVESAYAFKKFMEMMAKYTPLEFYAPNESGRDTAIAINIETFQAYNNLDEILAYPHIDRLKRITVGRVDLCGSLGLSRDDINSNRILEITQDICRKARAHGVGTTIGGGIARESIPFINKLVEKNLLDRFETRKIVFSIPDGLADAEAAIIKANRFELLWLANKRDYYTAIANEDADRIKMLERRSL